MKVLVPVGASFALGFAAQSANADFVVAPNTNTSTSGNAQQFGVLDTLGDNVTFQFVYSAAQFSTIPIGTEITGIGFRLPAGASTVDSALVYSSFSLQIGQSTAAPGSLSTTFATNEASDTVTALSGPMTIAAGSFVGGTGPNPFFELAFTTPYTFTGGNLLITIGHTDPGASIALDANTIPSLSTVTDTIANFTSDTATGADGQGRGFYNSPIAAFYFSSSAVPEPPTSVLLALGSVFVLAGYRFRRQTA